jgi:hypothetical protein
VTIDSAAGRYDPAYYAVAGLVARPFHGDGFLFAMRAVTAVLSCALLTAALWSVLTWTRTRWPLVALLLVITPTTLYSSTVAAPNGVHMSAAIALWCALLGLGRGHEERPRFGLLLLMAVASAVTACTHSLGILWVPLIFFVAWYARGAPHVRGLLAAVAPARGWVLALVLPYLAAAAWVVLARTNSPHDELTQHRAGSPLPSVLAGWLRWPLQTISAAPNRVDGSPTAVYAIWMVGAGLLIWVASRRVLHRREYHAVVVLVALSVVIPSALTCMTFSQLGAAWQGRYGYPLSVGVLLVLATAADRTRRRELPAVLAGLGVALLTLGQVVAQISARDHSAAAPGLVRATHWHPPGTMLFVLCGIVACVLLVRSLAVTAPAARPTPRPASSPATTVA